jgi:hypothetical protein
LSVIDVWKLEAEAKQAYLQKRTKQCFALTKSLLAADPQNKEARSLDAAIRSELEQEFETARALLLDSQHPGEGAEKNRTSAEIILCKILNIDPDYEEAKGLLVEIRGIPEPVTSRVHPPQPPMARAEPSFTVAYVGNKGDRRRSRRHPIPMAAGLIVAMAIGGVLIFRQGPQVPESSGAVSAAAGSPAQPVQSAVPAPRQYVSSQPVRGLRPAFTVPALPATIAERLPGKGVAPAAPAEPVSAPVSAPPAAPKMGTLAVNSPVAAEIYVNDKLVASTPTTLELPEGSHTLEYRHADFRRSVTHVVRANETTTAMVTFDVTLQINARPWAQVFIEASPRRPLGQTPLSDVRIPIGSLLVFENPQFPAKSYRVAGRDTAIQMIFP